MGKERGKQRKHLLLHGACVLIFLLFSAGCATISDFQKKWEGQNRLDLAENRFASGDYEGAMKAYNDVIKMFPSDSPGDRALYRMGLIWADSENPQRDYKKALTCFQSLVTVFPRSALKNETVVWMSVINKLIGFEGRARDLEDEVGTLKRRLNCSKKEVNTLKDRFRSLKEIDIGIEEKKRKNLP